MSDMNNTDASVSEVLKNNKQFWLTKIQQSQSVEELEVWKEKAEDASILLMKEAQKLSVDNDESLSVELRDASQELINECADVYDKRIKEVPASITITKNALWPAGGVGLSTWGVVTLFVQAVPVANIALGITTLAYAGWEWVRRTKKLSNDINENQSFDAKAQSGIRLGGASIGVAMGVLGVLEMAGVFFPPALVLPLAVVALSPVAVDAYYWAKNYVDTKKEIKIAEQDGSQQLKILDDTSSHFTRQAIVQSNTNVSAVLVKKTETEFPHLLYDVVKVKKEPRLETVQDLDSVADIDDLETFGQSRMSE